MELANFNNLQDMRNCAYDLLEQLAGVEAKMDGTQSHSDQELLDQAWEDLNDQIALLQEMIEMADDADSALNAEDDDDGVGSWEGSQTSEEEEEEPIRSHTIQRVYKLGEQIYVTQEELDAINRLTDDRVASDYYEAEFGVYYNAADEV